MGGSAGDDCTAASPTNRGTKTAFRRARGRWYGGGRSEKNNKRKIAKYGGKSSLARFALQFQIERKNVYTALITSKM
jgi:hypothetical protein